MGGGGTPYNGIYREAPPERGTYSRPQVYERIGIYYIHTEKYSPNSYVVNFRTQISYSQSEERTMVFTREKNDTSNQNRERCFFTCEKNDTSNQKPQRCRSFAPKFPPFIAACSAGRGNGFPKPSITFRTSSGKWLCILEGGQFLESLGNYSRTSRYGHPSNTDTSLCPLGDRIREVRL